MRSIALFVAAIGFASSPAVSAEPLFIPADKIYPAPDAKPLANGGVLVRDGRVAGISDASSRLAIPEGTTTSECRGVVVAGFHNSHVHFMQPRWNDAAHADAATLNDGLAAMLLRYGYTTVFDTGSDRDNTVALRGRIEKRELLGPRILTAGLGLFPPEGIPGYVADLPPEVLDLMPQPRNAEEARRAVRDNLGKGADATKLFLVTWPTRGQVKTMTLEVARAAVEESHRLGKPVLAHPTSPDGVRLALAAGVDVLVHTTLDDKAPWDADLVREMVAKNMAVMPTFKLWHYELAKDKVPANIAEMLVGRTLEQLRALNVARGQVLFGTDVGYMHDYDPTDEYLLMAKAGMTPEQILASLTTEPAARWKLPNEGRIKVGEAADLVVLDGDPAEDVKNFAHVRCVFRDGTLVYSRAP
jgi:imidazolonepropionase-like amidohydrolase